MKLLSVTALKSIIDLWFLRLIVLLLHDITIPELYKQIHGALDDITELVCIMSFKAHIREWEADSKCLMTVLFEKDLLLSKNTLPLLVRIAEQRVGVLPE